MLISITISNKTITIIHTLWLVLKYPSPSLMAGAKMLRRGSISDCSQHISAKGYAVCSVRRVSEVREQLYLCEDVSIFIKLKQKYLLIQCNGLGGNPAVKKKQFPIFICSLYDG